MTGIARLGGGVRRVALGLIIATSLGAAVGMLVGCPAFASGETSGSPTEPTGTGTSNCPSSNPPNQMTLVAGTPQTAILQSAFASGLQVALTNSDGCPVTTAAAGVPVTFSAPAGGASGVFSTSGSNAVIVGADSSGAVMAPTFTANGIAGGYTVTASSRYGSVSFSLTNTAAGVPARIVAIPLKSRSASVSSRYRQALAVKVLDGDGNPVVGASVTFTLTASTGSSACGTSSSSSAGSAADASFADGATQASATSNASGIATSPALTANGEAGTFTASAALGSSGGSEPHGGTSTSSVAPALFTLTNLAGKPAKIAPGVGSTQSTAAGSAFPIRLAVTVTDAQKNPVPGALVTFSAPGAGGRFTIRSHGSRRHRAHITYTHTVAVKTGACGIAVAPPFTAGRQPGGYIVKASAKPARSAAFALVNEAPGQSQ
jgi:protocatechuate 3,4-dioxygenase beta subunit